MSANAFGVETDVVSKANWKTIDQRERAQRQNRKHAAQVAGLGSVATIGGAYYGAASPDAQRQLDRMGSQAKTGFKFRKVANAQLKGVGVGPMKGNVVGDVVRGAKAGLGGPGKGKGKAVVGLMAGGIAAGVGANAAASSRNSYHQHKINERRRAAEGKRAAVSKSAFGIEHDVVSKRKDPGKSKGKPTSGRRLTANLFPGFHGAAAGRKGTKLKAVGHELGGNIGGGIAGGGAGALAGAALGATRGKAVAGMDAGKAIGTAAGSIVGTDQATKIANKKGYYKKQKVAKAFDNENSNIYRGPTERKAVRHDKKYLASGAAVAGGYGAAMTGLVRNAKSPSRKNLALVAGGLGTEAAATGYGVHRANKVAADARKKAGLKPRSKVTGFVQKNGVSKAFSTKPLMGAMQALKPKIAGPANKAMKLQPVKNAAAGFKATKVGVARGSSAPVANKVGAHAGIAAGHAATAGGAAMGAAGVGVGLAAGKKRR